MLVMNSNVRCYYSRVVKKPAVPFIVTVKDTIRSSFEGLAPQLPEKILRPMSPIGDRQRLLKKKVSGVLDALSLVGDVRDIKQRARVSYIRYLRDYLCC